MSYLKMNTTESSSKVTSDLASEPTDEAILADESDAASPTEEGGNSLGNDTHMPTPNADLSKKEQALQKRRYLLMEVVETEKSYIDDLSKIVCGYMKEMREMDLPEDLQGKDRMVFGNIEQIYDWHRETFQVELEKALQDFDRLPEAFIRYEKRLYMYVKYCENKPKADFIVEQFLDTLFEDIRLKLGHKHNLPDLLITPVQRIQRYQLLLRDIVKQTKKAEEDTIRLNKALDVMCKVPKEANDMMEIGRLQGWDGKVTAQGKLRHQDTLQIAECIAGDKGKFKARRVFLFDQIFILSDMTERRRGNITTASYAYKNSVQVNKMDLREHPDDEPLQFVLEDKSVNSNLKLFIECIDDQHYQQWTSEIKQLMDMQRNMLYALQNPTKYQEQSQKKTTDSEGSGSGSSMKKHRHAHANTAPLLASGGKGKKKEDKGSRKSLLDGLKSTFGKKRGSPDEGQGMAKDRRPSPDVIGPRGDPCPNEIERKFSTMIQPLFLQELSDAEAYVGQSARFQCTLQGKPIPDFEWVGPGDSPIEPNDKFRLSQEGNRISLSIATLRSFDAGSYAIRARNEMGSNTSTAELKVLDNPDAPRKPAIKSVKGTSVLLEWLEPTESNAFSQSIEYTVQYQHTKDCIWHTAILRTPNTAAYVHHLVPGANYRFRVYKGSRECSSPESDEVQIAKDAVADGELREKEHNEEVRWKTTFGLDYIQMDTIAKGKYAVIRKCQHKESGLKFAAKRVSKKRGECTVAKEFHMLATLSHENVVKVNDLYESENYFVMVLELLNCSLCEHLCRSASYLEQDISLYTGQLCNALMYLHSFDIGHLDLKPEHLLIGNSGLKVIDFGDAENLSTNHVATVGDDLEFTAPEIVKHEAACPTSDVWSVGTIVAVLLTGKSVFYDANVNEMTRKIESGVIDEDVLNRLSDNATNFIRRCIRIDKASRPMVKELKGDPWLKCDSGRMIESGPLVDFMERRKSIL